MIKAWFVKTLTEDSDRSMRRRRLVLWAAFTLELAALLLVQLPSSYDFSTFVFFDPGSTLRADLLVTEGFAPTIDFGYPYGLLSLLCGRLFLSLGGRTPAAYLIGTLLLECWTMWGMARMAARWRWESIALLIIAMPHAILPVYLSFTHPFEAALLTNAFADLSLGRRARALALATACVLVKPSMAYFLGLLLLIAIARSLWRARNRDLIKSCFASLLPATLTAIICAAASALYFGLWPLLNSLLPLSGKQSYDALDFGFFGNGRRFWQPELTRAGDFVWYYVTTPAGFWIVASLLLCAWGLKALWRRAEKTEHEALIALAACHLFFIFVLFAWPGSWTYYSYLLVVGVCLGWQLFSKSEPTTLGQRDKPRRNEEREERQSQLDKNLPSRSSFLRGLSELFTFRFRRQLLLAPLVLLAFSGHVERYRNTAHIWRFNERSPVTAGLWADGQQREEWSRVLDLARRRPLLFLHNGCADLLFPEVEGAQTFFFSPACQTPREIDNLRRQIDRASVIVSFNHAAVLDPWNWPEFAGQRTQFQITWRGFYITIHERK